MASSKIIGRTRARVQAIQLLFQAQVQGVDVFDLLADGSIALEEGPLEPFAEELARGVALNRLAIVRLLDNISRCWSYSRMPIVDRTIMSIALFEMFMQSDTPTSVAISEAVEISKVYGGDDSSNFVNGILGNVSKLMDAQPGITLAALANQLAEASACDSSADLVEDEACSAVEDDVEDLEGDVEGDVVE